MSDPPAPSVICFISSKGGSGKTITSFSVGRMLAHLKFRVLIVDADAATNGMTLLCMDYIVGAKKAAGSSELVGMFDNGINEQPTPCVIKDNLTFIPASYRMTDTENAEQDIFLTRLMNLKSAFPETDYIIIDAQAGADYYARSTASYSDECVIVSEYDPISVQGVDRLKILFADVLRHEKTWILFNKILPEFAKAIGEGLLIARYLPPITWDAEVVRAFATRQPVLNLDNPNPYTLAIAQILKRIYPNEVTRRIDDWLSAHRLSVTKPYVDNMRKIEDDIDTLIKHTMNVESKVDRQRFISYAVGIPIAVFATLLVYLIVSNPKSLYVFYIPELVPGVNIAGIAAFLIGVLIFIFAAVMLSFWRLSRAQREARATNQLIQIRIQDLTEQRSKYRALLDAADSIITPAANLTFSSPIGRGSAG